MYWNIHKISPNFRFCSPETNCWSAMQLLELKTKAKMICILFPVNHLGRKDDKLLEFGRKINHIKELEKPSQCICAEPPRENSLNAGGKTAQYLMAEVVAKCLSKQDCGQRIAHFSIIFSLAVKCNLSLVWEDMVAFPKKKFAGKLQKKVTCKLRSIFEPVKEHH